MTNPEAMYPQTREEMQQETQACNCRDESEDRYNAAMREGESLDEWRQRQFREIKAGMKSLKIEARPF